MVSRDGRLVQKGHQRFSFKIIPQHNRKMLILALLVTRCIRYLSVWLSGLAVCTLYTLINGFTGLGDLSHVPPCFFGFISCYILSSGGLNPIARSLQVGHAGSSNGHSPEGNVPILCHWKEI